jgi:hypothetical protein
VSAISLHNWSMLSPNPFRTISSINTTLNDRLKRIHMVYRTRPFTSQALRDTQANPLHKHIGALPALSPSQVRLLANSQPLGPQSGTASGSMADLPITPSKSRVASFESTSPHKSGKDSSSISSKSKGSGFFKF